MVEVSINCIPNLRNLQQISALSLLRSYVELTGDANRLKAEINSLVCWSAKVLIFIIRQI